MDPMEMDQTSSGGDAAEQRIDSVAGAQSTNSVESATSTATNGATGANIVKLIGLAGIPDCTILPFIDVPPPNILCAQCKSLGPSLWRFHCGHGFCGDCFAQLMPAESSKTICPIDQKSVSRITVFQDSSVQESAFPLRARCPHDCGDTIRLCTLPVHLQFCQKLQKKLATKRCFLRVLGCQFESDDEEELNGHERDLRLHRSMISEKLEELNHLDQLRNQVNEALSALIDATRTQTDLRSRIALLEGRLEELRLEDGPRAGPTSNSAQASAPLPTFSPQMDPMTITTYGGDTHIPALGATSTTRGAQELICPNGIFQWKLSEYSKAKFKERHSHKKYTNSPSFYAGAPGYLFKLRVHLNGIGSSSKGKYLAVGIVLMKGQFDEQLSYPIHNPITVTLVDQSPKCPEDVEYVLGDPCFQKPQGDYLVPYTWHEFVKFEDLESPRFLVDDSIIFRIQIAPLATNGSTPPWNTKDASVLYPKLH